MKPKILVLSGYGINCERETKQAFDFVGGDAEIVHVNDLINKEKSLEDYQILAFPGGFSYGDDTGSGNAMANKIRLNLWDELMKFVSSGKLIIGICNGFQILINLGLLPAINKGYGNRQASLTFNNSTRYECRWVHIKNNSSKCVFTKNIEKLHVPVAHGEGKFFASDDVLDYLEKNNQIVFTYSLPNNKPARGQFPFNPNGALKDIAGICDETGRILGMMPHPERAILASNSPDFQKIKEKYKREKQEISVYYHSAINIFKNAVDYIKEHSELLGGSDYASAGVDVDENHLANNLIKKIILQTFDDKVVVGLEGLFSAGYKFDRGEGNFIGQKIVFISNEESLKEDIQQAINEIEKEGGKPLFLTDYLAFGKLKATKATRLVLNIINSVRKEKGGFIPLIGGEVAEMPGVIKQNAAEIVIVITYQTKSSKEGLIDISDLQGDILTTSNDSVGTKTKLGLKLNLMDNLFNDMVGHSMGDIGVQLATPLGIAMYVGHSPSFAQNLINNYLNTVQSSKLENLDFVTHGSEIYCDGEFDIVGSILGIVDENNLLAGKNINKGDHLIGWKSFGVNTNGYSLIRKLGEEEKINYNEMLSGTELTVGQALMQPHEDYRVAINSAKTLFGDSLKGIAHITGGGIKANTIRLLPENVGLTIKINKLPYNPIFDYLQKRGNISEKEMNKTFNRGVGIVFVVDKDYNISNLPKECCIIGEVIEK